jgi:prepilin-type N-terminal cleavage/methylation domain-containing protein
VKTAVRATVRTLRIGKSGNRGFTFLELAVVLTLLGLFSVLTVPSLQGMLSGDKLDRAARNMATVIRHARGLAAGEGTLHYVRFDLGEGKYWLSRERGQLGSDLQHEDVIKRRRLPDGVSFKDVETNGKGMVAKGETVIHFWSSGLVEMATIHLRDDNNRQITLFVNPVTGSVRMEESYVRRQAS